MSEHRNESGRPRRGGRRAGAALLAALAGSAAAPARAESTPEGTSVVGVRAGSTCVQERVRITGFAQPREEGGASIPFEGYRITEILAGEGDTVTAGQELVRAVRLDDAGGPARPPAFSLRAPMAGRITRLALRVGQITEGPGVPMGPGLPPEPQIRIAGEAGIDLLVDVPSPYAAKIRAGAAARVIPDAGAEARGTVRVPASEVDPRSQLGRARLTIEPATALRPGQFASAVIETARDCGVAVPRAAVTYRNGNPTVQVLNGTAVETRSVRTGLFDESSIRIRDGLKEGEPVVATAGTALRAGDRVTPVITEKQGGASNR